LQVQPHKAGLRRGGGSAYGRWSDAVIRQRVKATLTNALRSLWLIVMAASWDIGGSRDWLDHQRERALKIQDPDIRHYRAELDDVEFKYLAVAPSYNQMATVLEANCAAEQGWRPTDMTKPSKIATPFVPHVITHLYGQWEHGEQGTGRGIVY
jgi:hypothetical protein